MITINNSSPQLILTTECIICGFKIGLGSDIEINEIIECGDCGSELEIESVNPIVIIEAPFEAEDWGE